MRHFQQWLELCLDVKDAFDKYGIDIPYPQRVVYLQNVDNSTGEIKGTKKKQQERMLPLMIVKKVKYNVESEIYDIFNSEFVYDVERIIFMIAFIGLLYWGLVSPMRHILHRHLRSVRR